MHYPKAAVLVALAAMGSVIDSPCATEAVTNMSNQKSSEEQRISDLVLQLAKIDIRNFDAVSQAVPGSWGFERSSRTDRVASSLAAPWLRGRHELFVDEDPSRKSGSKVTGARLTLELSDSVCFSGESFGRPEYFAGTTAYLQAQSVDGGGFVAPYIIDGRRVWFTYLEDSQCVGTIMFSISEGPDG